MARPRARLATLADVDLLVRHRRGMWTDIGKHAEADLDAADPVYRGWIRARLRSGRAAGFIVESRGRGVASGVMWLMDTHPRPGREGTRQAYLMSMYTEPAHRRRGHAAAVVEAALAWTRAQGVDRVALHATPKGRAIYERAGFEPTNAMRLVFSEA